MKQQATGFAFPLHSALVIGLALNRMQSWNLLLNPKANSPEFSDNKKQKQGNWECCGEL